LYKLTWYTYIESVKRLQLGSQVKLVEVNYDIEMKLCALLLGIWPYVCISSDVYFMIVPCVASVR
jgi:hypothetical protein